MKTIDIGEFNLNISLGKDELINTELISYIRNNANVFNKLINDGFLLPGSIINTHDCSIEIDNSYNVIIDIVDSLPKNKNVVKYKSRDLSKVEHIVIHHSAGNLSPQAVAEFHTSPEIIKNGKNIGGRNWPGIAYHFYLYKDKIYMVNRLETISFHVANNNTKCIGICVNGNYEKDKLENKGLIFMQIKILVDYIEKMVGRKLSIKPHNFFKATACPGNLFPFNDLLKYLNKV